MTSSVKKAYRIKVWDSQNLSTEPATEPPSQPKETESKECPICHVSRPVGQFRGGTRTFNMCKSCRYGTKPQELGDIKCPACKKWCAPQLFTREGSDTPYKKCTACREYHRSYQKQLSDKGKNMELPNGQRWCVGCKTGYQVALFSTGKDGKLFMSCDPCRAKSKEWYDANRDTILEKAKEYNVREQVALKNRRKVRYANNAEEIKQKQRDYNNTSRGKALRVLRHATERGIENELSVDEAIALVDSPCFYCGRTEVNGRVNGVDRLCSDTGYMADNCVPCCWPCNNAKGATDPETFVQRLVAMNVLRSGRATENTAVHLWGVTRSMPFSGYASAKKRGEPFGIDRATFDKITAMPCVYCARPSMDRGCGRHGLDRIDNAVGYREDNVRSCCRECNFMRGECTVDEFMEMVELVADRADVTLEDIPQDIKQCLTIRVVRDRPNKKRTRLRTSENGDT